MKPLERLQVWVGLFWVYESEEILGDSSSNIFFPELCGRTEQLSKKTRFWLCRSGIKAMNLRGNSYCQADYFSYLSIILSVWLCGELSQGRDLIWKQDLWGSGKEELRIFTEPDQLSKPADKMPTLKIPSFDWLFWKTAGKRRKWDEQGKSSSSWYCWLGNVSLDLAST